MNRPAKFILWTVGVIVAIPVLLIVLLPGCKNIVPTTEYAPSGRYMAEAEDYDCGAVSRFETIVMIRQRPFWLSNSFFGRGAHILIFEGPPQRITLQWKNGHELEVECHGCSEMSPRVLLSQWKGVTVHYTFVAARPHEVP